MEHKERLRLAYLAVYDAVDDAWNVTADENTSMAVKEEFARFQADFARSYNRLKSVLIKADG